ncbi:MAG: CBS domain-containing protein [Actinomycetota bacterium]|nr:CBS domain-containing protein [Actinomycetota bacterium]
MNISDILRHKGSAVVTIASTGKVRDLVAELAEHKIGALVVVDGDSVIGVASERDVVYRLHERGAEVLDAPVSEVMTAHVVTCSSKDSVDSVAATMTERRIRHMPVLDDGTLNGIVTIGDVVSIRIRQLEHDRGQLEQYITG